MKIPTMSMLERALDYPYQAPEGDYLLSCGHCLCLPDDYDFRGRTAVLSVGSNRAPAQLFRKFGNNAKVPVTEVVVTGCDVVHVAGLSGYGAVPCAPFPSEGTTITLNIAWLTETQLLEMHATESVGIAYDFVEWDTSSICLSRDMKLGRLFGYASCIGAFEHRGHPAALTRINAENRVFPEKTQDEMQLALAMMTGYGELALQDWVQLSQSNEGVHQQAQKIALSCAVRPEAVPWTIIDF